MLCTGASVPTKLGCLTLPAHECLHNLEACQLLMFKGFWQSLVCSSPPFPFLEVGGWGKKFQPSNYWVFLVTSPILRLSRGPILSDLISINSGRLHRYSLRPNRRHSYYSGNSKGFRRFLPGTEDKDQICCTRHVLLLLLLLLLYTHSFWQNYLKVSCRQTSQLWL